MASTKQQQTSRTLTLAAELEALDAAVQTDLPPGVSLVIDDDPLDRYELSAVLRDWRHLVGIYAKPTGSYEELLAYSPFLANEARAFARSVRVALSRYLGGGAPIPRSALAVSKCAPTRQLWEARPEKRDGRAGGGPFPWVA